jgi:hypothetical protein
MEAHAVEGHLYIFCPKLLRDLIPGKPTGAALLEKIHQASLEGRNGELLGYGADRMLQPGSVLVRIIDAATNRVVMAFYAERSRAEEMGRERALDFSRYTGGSFKLLIQ